jgi:hypothetical protein
MAWRQKDWAMIMSLQNGRTAGWQEGKSDFNSAGQSGDSTIR